VFSLATLSRDGNGELSIGYSLLIPSTRGEKFPIPAPAKTHGGHFLPILVPCREYIPDGDPHPRYMMKEQLLKSTIQKCIKYQKKTHFSTTSNKIVK
jgi:hypothetical protein